MASTISSISAINKLLLFACLFSVCLLCSLKKGHAALEERETTKSQQLIHHHTTVQVSSLLPSPVCKSASTKASGRKSSLKLVHKHGPCNQFKDRKHKSPSHAEILLQDESRVNSIQSRLAKTKLARSDTNKRNGGATLPANHGNSFSIGNYIVTVGLGTPKKDLTLIFDTGSDLTWTQCEPCVRYCYPQKEKKFNPAESKTYTNVSCTSPTCNSLTSATGNSPSCSSSTCVYGIQYGDSSFSVGFFGKETLTLTPKDVFPNFIFGCGQNNRGIYGSVAGLLGLGRHPISFVSQTAAKYKKVFSYCLPATTGSTGHLTFGGPVPRSVKFTPLSTSTQDSSFYGLDITALSVGDRKLDIAATVFSTARSIIDSGTVITRLPPDAYSALRSAFRESMKRYPTAPALSILDTCYDFSNHTSVTVPKISFFFSGNVEVELDFAGIFYASSLARVCLAFAGNSDAGDVAIIGNTQQQTLEVVYDAARGKVGFAAGGCR